MVQVGTVIVVVEITMINRDHGGIRTVNTIITVLKSTVIEVASAVALILKRVPGTAVSIELETDPASRSSRGIQYPVNINTIICAEFNNTSC